MEGEEMELDEIYRNYYPTVYKYILSLSGNKDAAEEITQETFFRAIKDIDSFKGECSIQTWLCTIGKNLYFKQLEKEKKKQIYVEKQTAETKGFNDDVEDKLFQHEEAIQIHKILHRLKEPYKEVTMLRIFSDLSFCEITELFGKSESWARVTYMRARRMIREKIEDET